MDDERAAHAEMNDLLRELVAAGGDGIKREFRLSASELERARRGQPFTVPPRSDVGIEPDGTPVEVYGG